MDLPDLTMYNAARLLQQAGPSGITTTQLALATARGPRNWMNQSNRANQFMRRLEKFGAARPGDREKQPGQYHQIPVRRWYAVSPWIDIYVERGAREIRAAERYARQEAEKSAAVKRREYRDGLLAGARKLYGPQTSHCRRERVIRHLLAEGLTLQQVGGVFCLTRERVRQIELGEQGPCTCLWCEADRYAGVQEKFRRRVARKVQ